MYDVIIKYLINSSDSYLSMQGNSPKSWIRQSASTKNVQNQVHIYPSSKLDPAHKQYQNVESKYDVQQLSSITKMCDQSVNILQEFKRSYQKNSYFLTKLQYSQVISSFQKIKQNHTQVYQNCDNIKKNISLYVNQKKIGDPFYKSNIHQVILDNIEKIINIYQKQINNSSDIKNQNQIQPMSNENDHNFQYIRKQKYLYLFNFEDQMHQIVESIKSIINRHQTFQNQLKLQKQSCDISYAKKITSNYYFIHLKRNLTNLIKQQNQVIDYSKTIQKFKNKIQNHYIELKNIQYTIMDQTFKQNKNLRQEALSFMSFISQKLKQILDKLNSVNQRLKKSQMNENEASTDKKCQLILIFENEKSKSQIKSPKLSTNIASIKSSKTQSQILSQNLIKEDINYKIQGQESKNNQFDNLGNGKDKKQQVLRMKSQNNPTFLANKRHINYQRENNINHTMQSLVQKKIQLQVQAVKIQQINSKKNKQVDRQEKKNKIANYKNETQKNIISQLTISHDKPIQSQYKNQNLYKKQQQQKQDSQQNNKIRKKFLAQADQLKYENYNYLQQFSKAMKQQIDLRNQIEKLQQQNNYIKSSYKSLDSVKQQNQTKQRLHIQQKNRMKKYFTNQVDRLTRENNLIQKNIKTMQQFNNQYISQIKKLNDQNKEFKEKYQSQKQAFQSKKALVQDLTKKLRQQEQKHQNIKLSIRQKSQLDKDILQKQKIQNALKANLNQITIEVENKGKINKNLKQITKQLQKSIVDTLKDGFNIMKLFIFPPIQQKIKIQEKKQDTKQINDQIQSNTVKVENLKLIQSELNTRINILSNKYLQHFQPKDLLKEQSAIQLKQFFNIVLQKSKTVLQIFKYQLASASLRARNQQLQFKNIGKQRSTLKKQIQQQQLNKKSLERQIQHFQRIKQKNAELNMLKQNFNQLISKSFDHAKQQSDNRNLKQKKQLDQYKNKLESQKQQFQNNKQIYSKQNLKLVSDKQSLNSKIIIIQRSLKERQIQILNLKNDKSLTQNKLQLLQISSRQLLQQKDNLKAQLIKANKQKTNNQLIQLKDLFKPRQIYEDKKIESSQNQRYKQYIDRITQENKQSIQKIRNQYKTKFQKQQAQFKKLIDKCNEQYSQMKLRQQLLQSKLIHKIADLQLIKNILIKTILANQTWGKQTQMINNNQDIPKTLVKVIQKYSSQKQMYNDQMLQYVNSSQKLQRFIYSFSSKLLQYKAIINPKQYKTKGILKQNNKNQFKINYFIDQMKKWIQDKSPNQYQKNNRLGTACNSKYEALHNKLRQNFGNFIQILFKFYQQNEKSWADKTNQQLQKQNILIAQKYTTHIKELQNQNILIKQQLASQLGKVPSLELKIEQQSGVLKRNNADLLKYQKQIKTLNQKITTLQIDLQKQTKQIIQLQIQIGSQKQQISNLNQAARNLQIQHTNKYISTSNILKNKDKQLQVINKQLIDQRLKNQKQWEKLQIYHKTKFQQLNQNYIKLLSNNQSLNQQTNLLKTQLSQQKAINQSHQPIFNQLIQKLRLNIIKPTPTQISTAIDRFNPQVGMKLITSTALLGMDKVRQELARTIEQFQGLTMLRSDILFRMAKEKSMINLLPKGAFIMIYKSKRNKLFGSYSKCLGKATLIFSVDPKTSSVTTFIPPTISQKVQSTTIQQTRYLRYGCGQMRLNMTDVSSININSNHMGQVYYKNISWSQFTGESEDKIQLAEVELHKVQWM